MIMMRGTALQAAALMPRWSVMLKLGTLTGQSILVCFECWPAKNAEVRASLLVTPTA